MARRPVYPMGKLECFAFPHVQSPSITLGLSRRLQHAPNPTGNISAPPSLRRQINDASSFGFLRLNPLTKPIRVNNLPRSPFTVVGSGLPVPLQLSVLLKPGKRVMPYHFAGVSWGRGHSAHFSANPSLVRSSSLRSQFLMGGSN